MLVDILIGVSLKNFPKRKVHKLHYSFMLMLTMLIFSKALDPILSSSLFDRLRKTGPKSLKRHAQYHRISTLLEVKITFCIFWDLSFICKTEGAFTSLN